MVQRKNDRFSRSRVPVFYWASCLRVCLTERQGHSLHTRSNAHPPMPSHGATLEAQALMPASSGEPQPEDFLDIRATLASEPAPLDFVTPDLLAGVGGIVSLGAAGVSMLTSQIGVSIAGGLDHWGLIGENPTPGYKLLIAAEDPEVVLIHRLRSMKKSRPAAFGEEEPSPRQILVLQGAGFNFGFWNGRTFEPSDFLDNLAADVSALRPRLVLLNTLNCCSGEIPENDTAAMSSVLSSLQTVLKPTESASLFLHQTSKPPAMSLKKRILPSRRGRTARARAPPSMHPSVEPLEYTNGERQ